MRYTTHIPLPVRVDILCDFVPPCKLSVRVLEIIHDSSGDVISYPMDDEELQDILSKTPDPLDPETSLYITMLRRFLDQTGQKVHLKSPVDEGKLLCDETAQPENNLHTSDVLWIYHWLKDSGMCPYCLREAQARLKAFNEREVPSVD
jgi:hypothetical protein